MTKAETLKMESENSSPMRIIDPKLNTGQSDFMMHNLPNKFSAQPYIGHIGRQS